MSFLEVRKDDVPNIYEFCSSLAVEGAEMSFSEITSIDEISGWIEDPQTHLFMLVEDKKVIALLKARQGGEGRSHAAFLSVAVLKSHRGKGLAQTINEKAIPILINRGVKILRAYIYSDNLASIQSALRDGFEFSGQVKMHHYSEEKNSWVDDRIYHKILTMA